MSSTLVKAGFKTYKPSDLKRIIMSVQSREKEGKTHFALTAPKPIAYISIDIGEEGVVETFPELIDSPDFMIKYLPSVFVASKQAQAKEAWEEFKIAFRAGLEAARTVIVDTATEAWELIRLARLGGLTKIMPYQYTAVNFEYRGLIREVYDKPGVNLILIHKEKELWANDKSTGKWGFSGQNDSPYDVQMNIKCWRKMDPGDPDEGISPHAVFGINVVDCRLDASLMGMDFEGEQADFENILAYIYG